MKYKKIIICALPILLFTGAFFLYRQQNLQQTKSKIIFSSRAIPKAMFPGNSRAVFDSADDMTIYSIGGRDNKQGDFQGYPIAGSARLAPETINELRATFYKNASFEGIPALCFFPHHAIRARTGNKTVDFLICFGCGHIETHYEGKVSTVTFSSVEKEAFDKIWRGANLPILEGLD